MRRLTHMDTISIINIVSWEFSMTNCLCLFQMVQSMAYPSYCMYVCVLIVPASVCFGAVFIVFGRIDVPFHCAVLLY